MCSFSGRKQTKFFMHITVWSKISERVGKQLKKTMLTPLVKQTEMKQISNSAILVDPSGVDSELELNKLLNKI